MATHAPVTVVARFLAKSGMEDSVKKTLMDMVAPTRSEEANISYDLYQSTDQPSVFILEENWQSKDGLAQHMQKPYFKQMDEALANTLAEHYTVSMMEMVSPEARQDLPWNTG